MERIEKTKKNIRISRLDEKTKQKLFNQFIKAGGEVIDEKKKRSFANFNRETQKHYRTQSEKLNAFGAYNPQQNLKKRPVKTIEKKVQRNDSIVKENIRNTQKKKTGRIRLALDRFIIRLHLYSQGVTDFHGEYITTKFVSLFDSEYKKSLIDMQMIHIDVFKQNSYNGKRIIQKLDQIDPMYYELIEMISNVFDRTTVNEILEHYISFPDIPLKTKDIYEPLMKIFKKLYPLNSYKDYLQNALNKSISLQMEFEKKKSSLYTTKKKKIKNDMYIIFNNLYPRLYWLFCHFNRRIIPPGSELEDAILIGVKDKPGKRKRTQPLKKVELPNYKKVLTSEKENALPVIPDEVKEGLKLMDNLNLQKIREQYDKKGIFKFLKDTDKILITTLLFAEFEKEYSFILTTNKIKYNIVSGEYGRLDYKASHSSLYNELRRSTNTLKEYANIISAYEKLKTQKPVSNTQYIEYSNRLTALEKERDEYGHNSKMEVMVFLEKLCKDLKPIIDDMNDLQKIVVNPNDVIKIDTTIEGEKKLNGKKVSEAIISTYNYARALIFRLSPEGDLGSGLEFDADENTIFETIDNIEKPPPTKKSETSAEKSIIDELEDFI